MILILLLFTLLLSPSEQGTNVTTITSPSPFQVFQRSADDTGSILISGHVETTGEYSVSATWNGFESGVLWQGDTPDFSAEWAGLPVWQSDLIVTVGGESYTVPNVGIGDIYIIAGQSNAVGHGNNYQMYTNTLGLRGSMFAYDGWKELADPTGIRADDSNAGGSIWPLLATYMLERGVPVAFVPTAKNSTSVNHWQPGQALYEDMHARIAQLPAPYARAVLWQQGEYDAQIHMTANAYATKLENIADALYADFGLPLYAAYLSNYVYTPYSATINQGITKAISERAYIYLGAGLHAMSPNLPNVHYLTDVKLQKEADKWFTSLAVFYP